MLKSTRIAAFRLASWLGRGFRPQDVDYRRVHRVVFVCKGNICRSAYANALARDRGLAAASYGLETTPGLPADGVAQRLAKKRGVSLDDHRTQHWIDAKLTPNDLVLAMEPWHLRRLGGRAIGSGSQVGLLGLWARPGRRNIKDPYGLPDEDFNACFDAIDTAIEHLGGRLTAARGSR
jgi:protein-tyrosine phosphatase